MNTTLLYRTTLPVSQVYLDAFLVCHQEHFPGNLLAVINNADDTECLIKCCGEMNIPVGLIVTDTYTVEQARDLLTTPEWYKPTPL